MLKPNIRFITLLSVLLIICYYVNEHIYYNPSSSEPIGYYFVYQSNNYSHGDLVLICLNKQPWANIAIKFGLPKDNACSSGTPYLIKRIVATSGDLLAITKNGVWVNFSHIPDSTSLDSYRGIELYPQKLDGSYHLGANEFFVLGIGEYAYDSRYFGIISIKDIHYKAIYLWG